MVGQCLKGLEKLRVPRARAGAETIQFSFYSLLIYKRFVYLFLATLPSDSGRFVIRFQQTRRLTCSWILSCSSSVFFHHQHDDHNNKPWGDEEGFSSSFFYLPPAHSSRLCGIIKDRRDGSNYSAMLLGEFLFLRSFPELLGSLRIRLYIAFSLLPLSWTCLIRLYSASPPLLPCDFIIIYCTVG